MRRSAALLGILGLAVAIALLVVRTRSGDVAHEPGAGEPIDSAAGPASDADVRRVLDESNSVRSSDLAAGGLAAERGASSRSSGEPALVAPSDEPVRPRMRRVLVDADGKAVVGARIGRVVGSPRDPVLAARADPQGFVTDAEGRFDMVPYDFRWPDQVVIFAPGRPPLLAVLELGTRIVVPPTVPVRGRVLERGTDRPLEDVEVRIQIDAAERRAVVRAPPVRTAADGTFVTVGWGTGTGRVTAYGARNSDTAEMKFAGADIDGVVLRLEPAGEDGVATGRVLLDGQALAGVRVVLWPGWRRDEAIASPPTGSDGVYRVGPVWSRAETLKIDGTDLGIGTYAVSTEFEVKEGRAEKDIVLPKRWVVAGRVTRAGEPVAGAVVAADRRGARDGSGSTTTDPSGSFRLVGLFERRPWLRLTATAPSGEASTIDVPISTENGDVSGVAIELGKVGRARGRVVTSDGRPIEGADVHGRSDARTDERGHFDVVADAGRARVVASCLGFVSRSSAWLSVPEGDVGVECKVVLDRGGAVTGRVLDEAGTPVRGAVVKVEGAAGIGGTATVRTWGDDGRFDSGVVAGDVLRLTVTAEGYAPRVLEGVAPDSEVEVVLQRAAR